MINKTLHIRRQASFSEPSYWEDFSYETDDENDTVATALFSLPVEWEHSCLQKKCGACAMVIDGRPRLACDTLLSGLHKDVITIEPLRKFPVVRDLLVDRSIMRKNLTELSAWLSEDATEKNDGMAYEASKCLQCGLCLEVCPNFYTGGSFYGMAAMSPMARLLQKSDDADRKRLTREYLKGVYQGCGKSLACRDVCPAGMDIEQLLVKSNKITLWRRLLCDRRDACN